MQINFKKSQYIIGNQVEFMHHCKSKFPMIHLSNVFFRDFHFAVLDFLKKKKVKVSYTDGEQVTREVGLEFEKRNLFKKLDYQTWMLNYPDFSLKKAS
jgi:hypothetical protein